MRCYAGESPEQVAREYCKAQGLELLAVDGVEVAPVGITVSPRDIAVMMENIGNEVTNYNERLRRALEELYELNTLVCNELDELTN